MFGKKGTRFRASFFTGLVALVTMVLVFSGCGSDSKPAKATAVKKAATNARASNPQRILPLLNTQGVKKAPQMSINAQGQEVFNGLTREQFLAKVADHLRNDDTAHMEIFSGVTVEQLRAKVAAEQEKSDTLDEIFPGVSRDQLQAGVAANLLKTDTKGVGVPAFPGAKVTVDQLRENLAQQLAIPREKRGIFPPSDGKPTKR